MKRKISTLGLLAVSILILQSCCEIVFKTSTGGQEKAFHFVTQDILFRMTKSAIHGSESWQDPIGFQAGATTPITFINKYMSVNAGAMVSMQGANWQEGSLEGKTSLWYVYVPFAFRYQHTSNFYGEIGLQPGFLVSAKDKYEGTTEN